MSRWPIRLRLTAAFAVAMVLVLAAAGLFVYLRLQADLDESVDAGLETRAAAVAASGQASAGAAGDPEEGFAQRLAAGGAVLDATGGARRPALTDAELEQAARQPIELERRVPGVEGIARMVAVPASDGAATAGVVVVVGQSLEDRDETLAGLAASFAIGGPIAVLLASLLGYVLAAAGLAPVEAMRAGRRGCRSSGGDSGCRCPRRTTRSGGWARRSTRCSTACASSTSASAGSSPTPATSCARRWP